VLTVKDVEVEFSVSVTVVTLHAGITVIIRQKIPQSKIHFFRIILSSKKNRYLWYKRFID
jgi:hypothetical protein